MPYCKTRWGSWHGVIRRLLILKKVRSLHIIVVQNLTEAIYHVRLLLNSRITQMTLTRYRTSTRTSPGIPAISSVEATCAYSEGFKCQNKFTWVRLSTNVICRLQHQSRKILQLNTIPLSGIYYLFMRSSLENGRSMLIIQRWPYFGRRSRQQSKA